MLNIETNIPQTLAGVGTKPFGAFKDDLTPGDNSGTGLIAKWPTDIYYALMSVVFKANLTPSGIVENVSASDFCDALTKLMEEFMSSDFLNPTPQLVPGNTIKLAKGVTRDPNDSTSEPILIPKGGADGLSFPGVTADSRIDRLYTDKTGTIFQILGVQDAFPVPPTLPIGSIPICRTLITTIGSPVLDNVQDLIFDERVQNRAQQTSNPALPGQIIMSGRINANGTINKTSDFGLGSAFSVVKPVTGTYDVTLTGISSTFANVQIIVIKNNTAQGSKGSYMEGVSDKGLATGYGTNVGFRVVLIENFHQSCGGCPYMDVTSIDTDVSFIVIGLD